LEEIEVDMDGEWLPATAPDWLTTWGVGPCIAVGIADDLSNTAWLIHSPIFGHDASALNDMISSILEESEIRDLKVWACGAVLEDDTNGMAQELKLAKSTVEKLIGDLLRDSAAEYMWGRGGNVEMIQKAGSWSFILA
jgi:hypothetical protein